MSYIFFLFCTTSTAMRRIFNLSKQILEPKKKSINVWKMLRNQQFSWMAKRNFEYYKDFKTKLLEIIIK